MPDGLTVFSDLLVPRCREIIAHFAPYVKAEASAHLDRLLANAGTRTWRGALNHIVYPLWFEGRYEIDALRDMAAVNYFALTWFRLQDDLMDQAGNFAAWKVPLCARYWDEFAGLYRALLPTHAAFWSKFRVYMEQWEESVLWERARHRGSTAIPLEPDDIPRLSHKAAALKIPCAAACLLSGNESALPRLEQAVDAWQVMVQLHDDWRDWRDDLAEENYTYLISRVAHVCSVPRVQDVTVAHFKQAILSLADDYFSRTVGSGKEAVEILADLGLERFSQAIAWEVEDVGALGERARRMREASHQGELDMWAASALPRRNSPTEVSS